MYRYISPAWIPVFEGEDEDKVVLTDEERAALTAFKEGKLFDQEAVNRLLATDKRALKKKNTELLTQLEKAQKSTKLSDEERTTLEGRIEGLKKEVFTKEELAREERKKARSAHEEEVTQLKTRGDTWKKKFADAEIRRALTDAAVAQKAFQPSQVVALTRGTTNLVPVVGDDGEQTGDFKIIVDFTETSEEGETKTLQLEPTEAIKRMSEQPANANLFEGKGTGGAGDRNTGPGGEKDLRELAKDTEAYRAHRKEMGLEG